MAQRFESLTERIAGTGSRVATKHGVDQAGP